MFEVKVPTMLCLGCGARMLVALPVVDIKAIQVSELAGQQVTEECRSCGRHGMEMMVEELTPPRRGFRLRYLYHAGRPIVMEGLHLAPREGAHA